MGVMQGRVDLEMERLFREGTLAGFDEGQLLARFACDRDQRAFAALVERHGPMVLGVCRQLLRDPNDVDDAFQATFLVLVRKAGSLRRTDLLGNWLYGVAYRVALRARSVRHRGETRGTASRGGEACSIDEQTPDRAEPVADALLRAEERPLIHDEIHRLPRKYQDPVVLCYLEGLTHEEAAARLGWPVGSVKGRLSRARDLLRNRLVRRGVAVSSAAMAAELVTPDLRAAVPGSLTQSTLKAALAVAAGAAGKGLPLAGPALSPSVTALSEGVIHAMNLTLVRSIVVPILVAGAVTTGGTVAAYQLGGGFGGGLPTSPPAEKAAVKKPAEGVSPPGKSSAAMVKEILADLEEAVGKRDIPPKEYALWSQRLREVELEGARAQDARIATAKRHLDRLRHMLDLLVKSDESRAAWLKQQWWETISRAEDAVRMAANPLPEDANTVAAPGTGTPANHPTPAPTTATPAATPAAVGGFGGGGGAAPNDGRDEQQGRVMIAGLSSHITVKDKNPRNAAWIEKLDKPVTLQFPNETPLEEVLGKIKETTASGDGKPMPIYVDPLGLQEADRTMTSPVCIELQDVPLKVSLRLLLKQLGLAYCVRDGVLVISSVNGILQELDEMRAEQAGSDPNDPFGKAGGMMQGFMSIRGGGGMM
ncbi:RNA polymerase sigma factor [Aquisphaera insulae]|uniref:RNA polymerase sigma factor n=1 Tax=Aquisphaera insulae TaxID=2712864 RepID=UPI0013EB1BB3|nr:RNA polymerase sigma factor [Aquisphaera insulae]